MNTHRTRDLRGRRNKNATPRALAISPILTALMFLTMAAGCSNEKNDRDYAVPDSLCGTPVSAKELTPFLPGGKQIKVSEEFHSGTKVCNVVVDRTLILTATQAWVAEGRTTAYFASGQTLKKIEHSIESGRFRFSGNEGFGKTRNCMDRRYKQELYVALQAQGSEHSDPNAMKRLITSYADRVEDSAACAAGAQ
ncbi:MULTISPECIES: hypothetical protein [Streptomyces]|uniref:hypothetical protein n=1 Tax=Streptomyces TaxID=1883 RepID=UPI0012FF0C6A|nr:MULTISPECIES: hypothetical protein [Streptomyces]MCP3770352.1 hypothetical protein [Streptomyces sp. MAR25Y5]